MSRVLVLANEHVNQRMAGPSIRSYELSRVLQAAGNEVILASPFPSDLPPQPFAVAVYDQSTMHDLVVGTDVVVLQGWVMERFPVLRESSARLVIDLYDPFPLEVLSLFERETPHHRAVASSDATRAVSDQIARGDFFMCASERQRDYWLGWLTASGRVNPVTYAADHSLRTLIDVVPFGLPHDRPVLRRDAIRDTFPAIADGDVILLWAGGIYNWFDPVTLIRAVARMAADRPSVRLVFMSTSHPNPDIQQMWTLVEARRVADELGIVDRNVFFNDAWVPYGDRADWLLAADVGVTTHFEHIETRFSFRTRVLDYFWAGLPVVCSCGDSLAEAIAAEGIGFAVPPEDPTALADALTRLVTDSELRVTCGIRSREYGGRLTWDAAAEPLTNYCSTAARAADRIAIALPSSASAATTPPVVAVPRPAIQRADGLRQLYRALPESVRRSSVVQRLRRFAAERGHGGGA